VSIASAHAVGATHATTDPIIAFLGTQDYVNGIFVDESLGTWPGTLPLGGRPDACVAPRASARPAWHLVGRVMSESLRGGRFPSSAAEPRKRMVILEVPRPG
jgi:hypothetical protein